MCIASKMAMISDGALVLGDCKDEEGVKGRCVAGAINNYTSQLLTYGSSSSSSSSSGKCNV
jgi:hypothetical protein